VKETEYKLNPAKITLSEPGTSMFKAENTASITHALELEGSSRAKGSKNRPKAWTPARVPKTQSDPQRREIRDAMLPQAKRMKGSTYE
jgi:hypothetical protein